MAIIQDPIQDLTSTNHSEFIGRYIDLILRSTTSEIKAMHAKILYDYMTVQGFNYVMEHQHFKVVAIKKAYDLKIYCAEFIELENSLNCFLIAIGEPLERVEIEDIEEDFIEDVDIEYSDIENIDIEVYE